MATIPPAPPLIVCPNCELELVLIGVELERPGRDVYTFECPKCHCLEVSGVAVP
jgi:Zn-finger nucleic acid-binding protein